MSCGAILPGAEVLDRKGLRQRELPASSCRSSSSADAGTLSFFSTMTVFGTPVDVTGRRSDGQALQSLADAPSAPP